MKKVIQEFEGYVSFVNQKDGLVEAILYDLTEPEHSEEFAELYMHSFKVDELKFIREGSIFDFKIFEDEQGIVTSDISLKRLTNKEKALIKKEKRKIKKRAEIISLLFED